MRWKELHEQPVGWEPDLNDGVRLNIRPFVEAGVLRSPFNIHWRKDRGKNPDGSERHNDIHLSLSEKREARKRCGALVSDTVLDRLVACVQTALAYDANVRSRRRRCFGPTRTGNGSRSSTGSASAFRSSRSATTNRKRGAAPPTGSVASLHGTIDIGLPDGHADRVPARRRPQRPAGR